MNKMKYTEDELRYNLKEFKKDLNNVFFRIGMLGGINSVLKKDNIELSDDTIALIAECKEMALSYFNAKSIFEIGVFENAK